MNKEDLIEKISRDGHAYASASPELKRDKDVAIAAVSKDGYLLQKVPYELKSDRDVVMAAVRQKGKALTYALSPIDRDVFMAAIMQNGMALEYAPELKADEQAVMAAITQNGNALRWASSELRRDPEFLWHASHHGYVPNEAEQALIQQYETFKQSQLVALSSLSRLNAHGPIFGKILKQKMSGFARPGGKRKTRRRRYKK
jgi:hypothetical protein